MRPKLFLIAILFLFVGCVPSRNFVNTHQEERISQINNELKEKIVKIRPIDEEDFKSQNVTITSDSLFYVNSEKKNSLALTEIKSITAGPKIGVSAAIGIPLVAVGILGVASFDDKGGFEELGKIYGGAAAITLGGLVLGIGNNIESETYYFKQNK